MKHEVIALQRIETEGRRSDISGLWYENSNKKSVKWCYDKWLIEVDSVRMEVIETQRVGAKKVLKFSNKGVRKHKDYEQIRAKTVEAINHRYDLNLLKLDYRIPIDTFYDCRPK